MEKKGSWYSKGDLRFSQGRRAAIDFLKEDEKLATEIEQEVRMLMKQRDPSLPIVHPDDVLDQDSDPSAEELEFEQ